MTPITPAVHLQNLRDLTGAERTKIKTTDYYSDTGDMGADFPQRYFDYLPKK